MFIRARIGFAYRAARSQAQVRSSAQSSSSDTKLEHLLDEHVVDLHAGARPYRRTTKGSRSHDCLARAAAGRTAIEVASKFDTSRSEKQRLGKRTRGSRWSGRIIQTRFDERDVRDLGLLSPHICRALLISRSSCRLMPRLGSKQRLTGFRQTVS